MVSQHSVVFRLSPPFMSLPSSFNGSTSPQYLAPQEISSSHQSLHFSNLLLFSIQRSQLQQVFEFAGCERSCPLPKRTSGFGNMWPVDMKPEVCKALLWSISLAAFYFVTEFLFYNHRSTHRIQTCWIDLIYSMAKARMKNPFICTLHDRLRDYAMSM